MTNRKEFLKRHNLDKSESLSLAEISKIANVPKSILQEVYDRGIGAYKTNPQSVRMKGTYKKNVKAPMSKKLSKEQWAYARVYSFVNKIQGRKRLNHDTDLAKKILPKNKD